MTVATVLIMLAVVVLVVGWLVLVHRESPKRPRDSSEYRHQHTENPEYLPGHAGQAGAGGI